MLAFILIILAMPGSNAVARPAVVSTIEFDTMEQCSAVRDYLAFRASAFYGDRSVDSTNNPLTFFCTRRK